MRIRTLIALVLVALVGLAPGTAAADTTPPTFPILPNQYFVGVVNGQTTGVVVVRTVCPGPGGGNGHPARGQTLSVSRVSAPTDSTVGFTGSLANSVAASPTTSTTANTPVMFTEYFVAKALPTSWLVPCDGPGVIGFVPTPTSSSARTAVVTVRFVNIAF